MCEGIGIGGVVVSYREWVRYMRKGDDANGAAYGMLALLPRVPIGRSEGVASAPALGARLVSDARVRYRGEVCMQQRLCCSRMRGRRLPRRGRVRGCRGSCLQVSIQRCFCLRST